MEILFLNRTVKREDLGGENSLRMKEFAFSYGKQGGLTMEETWKHFVATGKVEDYLKFCEERKKQEVKPDGSKPNSNGTGYQCHANGRV